MSEILPVTDAEARKILSRFIASHFKKPDREHARFSIPVREDRDDDVRMSNYIDEVAALRSALAEREAVLCESNAVCACGCPASEHESYGEDGESCGEEGHECVRTSRSVAMMLVALRFRVAELETEVRALTNERNAALDLSEKRGAAYDIAEARVAELEKSISTNRREIQMLFTAIANRDEDHSEPLSNLKTAIARAADAKNDDFARVHGALLCLLAAVEGYFLCLDGAALAAKVKP